jgi:hypothetical protein
MEVCVQLSSSRSVTPLGMLYNPGIIFDECVVLLWMGLEAVLFSCLAYVARRDM